MNVFFYTKWIYSVFEAGQIDFKVYKHAKKINDVPLPLTY